MWDDCCTFISGGHYSSRRKYMVYTYRHIDRDRPTRCFETNSPSSVGRRECLPIDIWCRRNLQVIYYQYILKRITSDITLTTIIIIIIIMIKILKFFLCILRRHIEWVEVHFHTFVTLSTRGKWVIVQKKIYSW